MNGEWWSGQNIHVLIFLGNELFIGGDQMYEKSFSNSLSTLARCFIIFAHQQTQKERVSEWDTQTHKYICWICMDL